MITRFLAALVLGFALGIPALPAAADTKDDVAAAYEAWDAAFNEGDAKAVAAFYTGDAKLLPPTHAVVTGPAEIETFFAGLFKQGVTGHDLKIIDVGGDGKIVYATARWSVKGGAGVATHVFERQHDKSLKLKVHTFN